MKLITSRRLAFVGAVGPALEPLRQRIRLVGVSWAPRLVSIPPVPAWRDLPNPPMPELAPAGGAR
jgi:hypothetical protein